MKKMLKKTFIFIQLFLLVVTLSPNAFLGVSQAADMVDFDADIEFYQSEAESMLAMVNEFRTGSDSWYWNSSDTEKIYVSDLDELIWDEGLEKVAMERAKEAAVFKDHVRPDGSDCFTLYPGGSVAENLAWPSSVNAASAYNMWREDNAKYYGQGHRRNMLKSNMKYIGIACAKVGGTICWAQAFSSVPSNKSRVDESLSIKSTYISGLSFSPNSISVKEGESYDLSKIYVSLKTDAGAGFLSNISLKNPKISAESANTSIATVSGKTITGVKNGNTNIKISGYGQTAQLSVKVESPYTVTFDSQGGSAVSPISVMPGNRIPNIPTPTKSGVAFDGWYSAPTGGTKLTTSTTINSDITYYARWKESVKLIVKFDAQGGTGVADMIIEKGSTISNLPVATKTGVVLDGWYSSITGGVKLTTETVINNNVTYYARWVTGEKITVKFDSMGGSAVADQVITKGSRLENIPTSTKANYILDGWYTASSGGTKLLTTTVINNNVTYFAQWKQGNIKSMTVTYSGGNVEVGKLIDKSKIKVSVTLTDNTKMDITDFTIGSYSIKEGNNTITISYNGFSTTINVVGVKAQQGSVLYRLYNKHSGEHLYTTDANEMKTLSGTGWDVETSPGNSASSGVAVYRLYNRNSGEHLYTADTNEVRELVKIGWSQDNNGKPLFYGANGGSKPVYRLFNRAAPQISSHHYTGDMNEIGVLLGSGWQYDNNAAPVYYLN